MKIAKKSLLIRWAYLPEILLAESGKVPKIPESTTLCEVLSRSLFGIPFFVLFFIPLGAITFCLLYPMVWLEECLPKTKAAVRIKLWWRGSVIRRAICDFKEKTCTRIEIK